ncbi:uncharacterized protein PAE49_004572 [Odontesthes bonariensis]
MRLWLATALVLLSLWLLKAQRTSDTGNVCEAVSMSEAVISLLLSPLSLYSWMTSTLLRLFMSVPALVLSALHHSLLLPLAALWCVASIYISLLVTCLYVTLYLLHVALVVGAVAILTLTQHKMADSDTVNEIKQNEAQQRFQQRRPEESPTKSRLRTSGRRVAQQG